MFVLHHERLVAKRQVACDETGFGFPARTARKPQVLDKLKIETSAVETGASM